MGEIEYEKWHCYRCEEFLKHPGEDCKQRSCMLYYRMPCREDFETIEGE